jgi:hypothetical protein
MERIVQIANKEAEIQSSGEDDKETEDDFFKIHNEACRGSFDSEC